MLKIALYNPLVDPTEFIERLRADPDVRLMVAERDEDIAGAVDGAEILITGNRFYLPEPAALIRQHGRALRWLNFVTSGIDKAVNSGLPPNVVVTNVAGVRAFAVAEHGFALMLGLARYVRASEIARLKETWVRDDITPPITNLARRHLVIVGTGAIGQEIARLAKAFNMHVTGISRSTTTLENFDDIRPREALVETAREADYLMVAALAGPQTDGMISRAVIDALRPTAFLINIARGSLVEEPALIEALKAGRIAGAGLDVMETEPLPSGHPLWSMENVLLTPHVAGAGDAGIITAASLFIDNLERWRAGQRLRNIVMEADGERAT
ncbi:MAG TPA: D-2-hydroxyacid dehydrogenase [Beijerinckiaceae bacterium]|jgi:phosphoglycerate dehydrogenase-like enzyme|nr:D-2-hydroxyacid dehydrogenase [Beijerinckiaceae bacterium]